MIILDKKIKIDELSKIGNEVFFDDMVKAVVDVEQEKISLNAELHSDLEEMMLEAGCKQENLYGINIKYESGEIEFDSLINHPRNRDAGYPKGGRDVSCPIAREKIKKVVNKWIG